jgi:hypothetical protein
MGDRHADSPSDTVIARNVDTGSISPALCQLSMANFWSFAANIPEDDYFGDYEGTAPTMVSAFAVS